MRLCRSPYSKQSAERIIGPQAWRKLAHLACADSLALCGGERVPMTIAILIEVATSDSRATTFRLSINGALIASNLGAAEAHVIIAKLFERMAPTAISRRRPRAVGGRIEPA